MVFSHGFVEYLVLIVQLWHSAVRVDHVPSCQSSEMSFKFGCFINKLPNEQINEVSSFEKKHESIRKRVDYYVKVGNVDYRVYVAMGTGSTVEPNRLFV